MRLTVARLATAVALLLLAAPLVADAQQSGKIPRIGVLGGSSPEGTPFIFGLRDGLRELGYVEGQNIVVEWRWAHGKNERLRELAAELVRLPVDVLVASGDPVILAAQRTTKTIPIVMMIASDPLALGVVASLARPGGNVTGLSTQSAELAAKRLQLLTEALPDLSRLAVLWAPVEPGRQALARGFENAAGARRIQPRLLEARTVTELDTAFAAATRERMDAIVVVGGTMFHAHRARIAELARTSRIPTLCAAREYVEVGCLMSYSASFTDNARRAARFVDRILKGAKPADLPVEQPTKFELVINMKTAKALRLTIPPALLLRADRVIE